MQTSPRVVLFSIGVSLLLIAPRAWAHTDVTVAQARDLIDTVDDLIVVDVRDPYEYCGRVGHIWGALNYPWNSGVLQARYDELPIDSPILVVGSSGYRSNQAANFLDSMGFGEVYDMKGGMHAWTGETVPHKYSGGCGTADYPYRLRGEHIYLLRESPEDYDKHFIMEEDIRVSDASDQPLDRAVIAPDMSDAGPSWDYEGVPFTGVFDGGGFKLSGLKISGNSYVGLFGRLGPEAIVRNLGLEVVDVNGTGDYVAALAGYNEGKIIGCYASGSVSGGRFVGGLVGHNGGCITTSYSLGSVAGNPLDRASASRMDTGQRVGGLAGENYGEITKCFSSSTVEGADNIGGLVGYAGCGALSMSYSAGIVRGESCVGGLVGISHSDLISACYSRGAVFGSYAAGGLVGYGVFDQIESSYSTAAVSGSEELGGLVGCRNNGTITTSYWDMDASGQVNSAGGIGQNTEGMQTAATFLDAGWDFVGETNNGPDDVWEIVEGQTYPFFSWQKCGEGTGEPTDPYLIYTAEHLNEIGTSRFDYGEEKHYKLMADIDLSDYVYDRAVIAPDWGGDTSNFKGTAFSASLDGDFHEIRNLTIDGNSYLGLIGMLHWRSKISNLIISEAKITGTGDYIGILGGLEETGRNWRDPDPGRIASCSVSGTVQGRDYVGGLLGSSGVSIKECSVNADVYGRDHVAGLLGELLVYNFSAHCRITDSYTRGNVNGEQHVGGFIGAGYTWGGESAGSWEAIRCYTATEVFGSSSVGAFLGKVSHPHPSYVQVVDCFYDQDLANLNPCGFSPGLDIPGVTASKMQSASTFLEAGWDFIDETANGTDDIWWIDEGQDYPRLWWELQN